MRIASNLARRFRELFGATPRIFQAPGRINLIGEHTDYNDGFVMPVAIDLSTWVAIGPRNDRKLVVFSEDFAETADALRPGHWSAYVHGPAAILEALGHPIRGANLAIQSNIPIGAGLGSSAALAVSAAYAILQIYAIELDPVNLARVCQRAEHEFAKVRCGIMDQMAACRGRPGHAMMLDTRSLEARFMPLPAAARIVICDTMVRHQLSSGDYNARRNECESAVKMLSTDHPEVRSLRDAAIEHLRALPRHLFLRSRHVITENERVRAAAAALEAGDLGGFGRLMAESHRSLRDDFEVSCPELNIMADLAAGMDGVYGARMTGGGFGGCTVNLVRAGSADRFRRQVAAQYQNQTGRRPDIYVCESAHGVHELSPEWI